MSVRTRLARLDATLAVRLGRIRADGTRRRIALVLAIALGIGLAWIHWLGLVAGGALVGLTRRGLARAVVAAAGFGTIVLVVTVFAIPLGATDLLQLRRLSLLTVTVVILLPVWGALVRGVI